MIMTLFSCYQLLDYDAARAKARKLGSKDSDPVTLRAVGFGLFLYLSLAPSGLN